MDDLSMMTQTPNASALPGATEIATRSLLDHCRGLIPNLARGKTEIILVPVGPGSRQVRADVFRDKDPCLRVDSNSMGQVRVRLVSQYSHLGGLVHHSGKLLRIPEAQTLGLRIARVYECGVGCWGEVDRASLGVLERAHVLMAAKMLRPRFSRFRSGKILSLLGLPSIDVLVHIDRASVSASRRYGPWCTGKVLG